MCVGIYDMETLSMNLVLCVGFVCSVSMTSISKGNNYLCLEHLDPVKWLLDCVSSCGCGLLSTNLDRAVDVGHGNLTLRKGSKSRTAVYG